MSGAAAGLPDIDLSGLPYLSYGKHVNLDHGACIMELASHVAGEAWSDHPDCVCPVLAAFMRAWNDALPDHERNALLLPLLPALLHTRSTRAVEMRRSMMAEDWLIRENLPAWLRLAGLTSQADTLVATQPSMDAAQLRADAALAQARRLSPNGCFGGSGAMEANATKAALAAVIYCRIWPSMLPYVALDVALTSIRVAATAGVTLRPTRTAQQQSAVALVHHMIAAGDRPLSSPSGGQLSDGEAAPAQDLETDRVGVAALGMDASHPAPAASARAAMDIAACEAIGRVITAGGGPAWDDLDGAERAEAMQDVAWWIRIAEQAGYRLVRQAP